MLLVPDAPNLRHSVEYSLLHWPGRAGARGAISADVWSATFKRNGVYMNALIEVRHDEVFVAKC